MRMVLARILGFFARRRPDAELEVEIEQHLELATAENIRRGMTPEEAARIARVHFGGVEQLKETHREQRSFPFAETLLQDLRYGARVLRKSPGFTIVAVLTLALGIGVNTTMFTAFNSVALKPLAIADPGSAVRLERQLKSRSAGNVQYAFSNPEYEYLRDHAKSFAEITASSWPVTLTAWVSAEETERIRCTYVSANYFAGLGVGAALGQSIQSASDPVALLSYTYWQRHFNSDPAVIGRAIKLNGAAFTVIGIVPADFNGAHVPPTPSEVYAPLGMMPHPENLQVQLIGRLQPGAGRGPAAAEMLVLLNQFDVAPPDRTVAIELPAVTLFGNTSDFRFLLTFALLLGLVSSILLIGCANLANMLMARAAGREREFAVRLALGACRGRLVRQLLTESVLLGLLGGVGGILLSVWATWMLSIVVGQLAGEFLLTGGSLTIDTTPDLRVLAFALLTSVGAGIAFGLLPALRFSKSDLNSALKGGSRVRSILIAGQAGVSILLLICAGLLTRGLLRSRAANPGFETRNAFYLGLDYNDPKTAVALQRRLAEQLAARPELRGVTLSGRVPLLGTWTPLVIVDQVHGRTGANRVGPEFFEIMGVPLLDGRDFTRRECDTQAAVAIISEAAARQFWPGQRAVGKHVRMDMTFRGDWKDFEVIGLARDARQANLGRIDPAFFYLPVNTNDINNILAVSRGDNTAATAAIRATVDSLDHNLTPSLTVLNLEKVPMRMQKLLARVTAIFALTLAGLALSLAAVGIHGVMAYLVSQRIKEIGIRMALGADAGAVVSLVVRQGLRPVLIGAAIGMAAAAALSASLRTLLQFPGTPDMLYGVNAFDPLTYIGLTLFLALVAMLASWAPARRATRVDPMVALRYE